MHIIIFPGRNKPWRDGIGDYLFSNGYNPSGIDLDKDFMRLRISDQLQNISNMISNFWSNNTILIGKSYGAYLLLQSLLDMTPFPGKIVLFSPVLGKSLVESQGRFFCSIPPRSKKILNAIKKKSFPYPTHIEIHTGANDDECTIHLAQEFIVSFPRATLNIIPDAGHRLDPWYENKVLINAIDNKTKTSNHENNLHFTV